MQGVLRTSGRPAKIKLRATVKGLPAGAEVEITDFMFQPDQAVSGWLPHVTELPWSAGMTYLNTAPGGEVVYWDDVEGKPVVFPPSVHKHSAADTTTGVFDPARIPVLGASHIGDNAVTLGGLSLALQDLLDQYQSTIADLQAQVVARTLHSGSDPDLNNYKTTSRWRQGGNSAAASGLNYPVPKAGLLEVVAAADVYQTYTVYPGDWSGLANNVYKRGYYAFGDAWGEWTLLGGA